MGLDIVIYRKDTKNEVLEIKESLHKAIFRRGLDLSETSIINTISDYYKTDVFFQPNDIDLFKKDLQQVEAAIDYGFKNEVNKILEKLNDDKIIKIHIGGD